MTIKLGVNIDHIATLREARGTEYPDPVYAALIAQDSGADGITLHLREDRRHIQLRDVELLKAALQVPMNLEMASTEEMVAIAEQVQPEHCCLVPEKREELTTEGGLDVVTHQESLTEVIRRLKAVDIQVSLFIDPSNEQIKASKECGASVIELHTGHYANSSEQKYLQEIIQAADSAQSLGLIVNAGHGLHYHNVQPIAAINEINELNIGHSIIAKSVFVGLGNAVSEMKDLMLTA